MSAVIGNECERILAYQAQADGLPPFRQNFRFYLGRKFEIDIAWPDHRVGCEINGGVWNSKTGAHGSPLKILRDLEKSNLLVMEGWKVLRFTPDQVRAGEAIAGLKRLLGGV